MQVSATRQEIDVLLKATLSQETHARNAFLQTLQVTNLLTIESPYSAELYSPAFRFDGFGS